MRRREALFAGGAAWVSGGVWAQAGAGEQIKPYLQYKPVAGDEKTVRVFFAAMCPFSKAYLQFFRNLSATLPADKTFKFTPVVNMADGKSFALAFAGVQLKLPKYVDAFVEAAMIASQDKGIATDTWQGLERIGQAARLPVSLTKLVRQNQDDVAKEAAFYVALQRDLQIINTPAVAVAGTYVVTPEFTRGDSALFSQLVNSIISMAR